MRHEDMHQPGGYKDPAGYGHPKFKDIGPDCKENFVLRSFQLQKTDLSDWYIRLEGMEMKQYPAAKSGTRLTILLVLLNSEFLEYIKKSYVNISHFCLRRTSILFQGHNVKMNKNCDI